MDDIRPVKIKIGSVIDANTKFDRLNKRLTEGAVTSSSENSSNIDSTSQKRFHTTRWSVVIASAEQSRERSEAALQTLCQAYWYPLYAFLRRKGHNPDVSQDLTQSFFAHLLEKQIYRKADRERGKFRTFLLTAFTNFVTNQWHKDQAEKRGGGVSLISIDIREGESRFERELADDVSPEKLFERRWATTILQQAIARLRKSYVSADKEKLFEALLPYLGGTSRSYQETEDDLGISLSAAKVSVHRIKKKCGEMLRTEIADTVESEVEIDEELAYLREVLGR